jgi:hypothetical protein
MLKRNSPRQKIIMISLSVFIVALIVCYFLFDFNGENMKKHIEIYIVKKKTKNYFQKCKLCDFVPQNHKPTSSFRDLLITVMYGTPTNILPALRSLRTTQSQATVVILTDNKTLSTIPDKAMRYIKHCSVEFEIVEKGEMSMLHFFTWRQAQYLNYIANHRTEYDRVIIFDLFDTVFQGDPFSSDLRYDKLYFSVENQTYSRSIYNQNLIKPLIDHGILDNISIMLDKPVINGGLFGGGINEVIAFLQLYMSNFKEDYSNVYVDDQPFINYLVHTKKIDDLKIPYELDMRKEMLVSVSASMMLLSSFVLGNVTHQHARYPALVIHQFKQKKEFNIEVYRACPRGEIDIPNYMPKLKERQIKEMERCLSENCSKLWYKN